MQNFIKDLKFFLEKVDQWRNEILYAFIKPHWPLAITPNQITYSRVLIGVGLAVMLFFLGVDNKILVLLLFFVGILTDFIDGPVARGTGRVTQFGAMLDSTADRILILPIAIYSLYDEHRWLLLALLLAEIINMLASIYYKSKEIYLEANIYGKTKMVLMSLVFVAILAAWPVAPSQVFIYVLWCTLPFSALSILAKIAEVRPTAKLVKIVS